MAQRESAAGYATFMYLWLIGHNDAVFAVFLERAERYDLRWYLRKVDNRDGKRAEVEAALRAMEDEQ